VAPVQDPTTPAALPTLPTCTPSELCSKYQYIKMKICSKNAIPPQGVFITYISLMNLLSAYQKENKLIT
jgi:hypothetical protein